MMEQTAILVEDWKAVSGKLRSFPWAKRLEAEMRPETDWWVAHYKDDPARISGWGHHYFCRECSSALVFDKNSPDEHRCGDCGSVRTDDEAKQAWNASYRSSASQQVFNAAVWYNLSGDPAYLEFIRSVLRFLSDHLDSFSVLTPPGYEGRFSGINLSDAVAVTWMLNGLELVRDWLEMDEMEKWKRQFFLPMADYFTTAHGGTPNISCWMRSAAGMIGLFFDEHEWCRLAADGFEGIRQKLADGLLPDGFWHEGSFVYHFLTADALTYYAVFCRMYGYDFPELTDAVRKMYVYPLQFAFPNGQLPSPNDGWPFRSFADYAHQYEWVRRLVDDDRLRIILDVCYGRSGDADLGDDKKALPPGGLPRLLFGTERLTAPAEARGRKSSRNRANKPSAVDAQVAVSASRLPIRQAHYDPDIYYCLLENEQATVFLKYGFVLEGHSHADIMNFELFAGGRLLSRDISNSGYGTDLFREWQRKSIAHNTVIVDKTNQPNRPPGKMLAFDAAANSFTVSADDVYPGMTFTRSLRMEGGRLSDEFAVGQRSAASVHTFDWLFHCSGELRHRLAVSPVDLPGDADGYQLMQDVVSCATDGDWEVSWELDDRRVTLAMEGCPGTTVYLFKGCEHKLDALRWGVMVRRSGSSALFRAEYSF